MPLSYCGSRPADCRWVSNLNALMEGRGSCRFVPPSVSEKYNLDVPEYQGVDQIVELPLTGQESKAEKILKLAERQDM